MDDRGLLRRAVEGDETSFELLVRRHADDMWRVSRSILRDDHHAEEAVQDAFLKAYRNLRSYRGEGSVRTWLLSICYRICIDRVRLRRLEVVSLDAVRERARPPDTELRLALELALDALPATQRQAFQLVHVLGYSREEAAAIAKVPASTMRARVQKARERLARSLGERQSASNGG